MPNVKISAAADAGTLLSSDMLPLARSGDTNAYHATMTEIATFTNASVSSGAYNNTGRNLVHNPVYTVQQRGTGPWTANANYTADRWQLAVTNDTDSVSIQPLADGDRSAIGDEAAVYCLQTVFTGSSTSNSNSVIQHKLEGVRRFSARALALSFWARASVGTPRIGVAIYQNFGSGGSPSPAVPTTVGATAALTATWARYTMNVTLPSAAGKTFGTTAGTDFCPMNFYLSDQANTSGTGIGVQSGTIQLWGVQLEYGSVATPLAKRDPADELALCQRFYYAESTYAFAIASAASQATHTMHSIPATMRVTPTVAVIGSPTYANTSALSLSASWPTSFLAAFTLTAVGPGQVGFSFAASADL